jgi:hypothetical protein
VSPLLHEHNGRKDELNLVSLAQQYSDDDKAREFTRRRQSRKIKKDK